MVLILLEFHIALRRFLVRDKHMTRMVMGCPVAPDIKSVVNPGRRTCVKCSDSVIEKTPL
jgi:hypothetical protein